ALRVGELEDRRRRGGLAERDAVLRDALEHRGGLGPALDRGGVAARGLLAASAAGGDQDRRDDDHDRAGEQAAEGGQALAPRGGGRVGLLALDAFGAGGVLALALGGAGVLRHVGYQG